MNRPDPSAAPLNEYGELRGEPDAVELVRTARALDTSSAPGPRPEFLATLAARMARERARPSLWVRLVATPAHAVAWAATLLLVIGIGGALALFFPQSAPTAIGGQRLVLVSTYGFTAYDPLTLQRKEQVNVPAPDPWVVLAPDQRTLVFSFGSTFRQMRVYDLPTATWQNVPLPEGSSPRQFTLSRDGSRAYVRDGQWIRIVDVAARSLVGTIPTPRVEDSPLYLAPDDRRLFQFLPEGGLVVYDVVERRELRRLQVDLRDQPGLSASARAVFSPDGARLYAVGSTGSPSGPVRVQVLDTATLATLRNELIDPATAPRLSRGGSPGDALDRLVVALGFVAEAKELGTVTQIALSPDGRTLYAARGSAGNGVLVIDAERLVAIGLLESGRPVFGVQLSPDGSRVYALAATGGVAGDATLLALDAGSHAVLASAPTRVQPDASVILFKQP